MALESCQLGPNATQVDKPVDGPQQVVLRDVTPKRELVEQRRLRLLPLSYHRRFLPPAHGNRISAQAPEQAELFN